MEDNQEKQENFKISDESSNKDLAAGCFGLLIIVALICGGIYYSFFNLSPEEKKADLTEKLNLVETSTRDIEQTARLYDLVVATASNPNINLAELKDKLDSLNHASYKAGNKFDEIATPKGLSSEKEKKFNEMKKLYSDACSTFSVVANETAKAIEKGNISKYELDRIVKFKNSYSNEIENANTIYNEFKQDI